MKENIFMHNDIKNSKYLGIKLTKEGKHLFVHWKLQDFDERNGKNSKQMERFPMFKVQKNLYY